jgi:hypothetical protein
MKEVQISVNSLFAQALVGSTQCTCRRQLKVLLTAPAEGRAPIPVLSLHNREISGKAA